MFRFLDALLLQVLPVLAVYFSPALSFALLFKFALALTVFAEFFSFEAPFLNSGEWYCWSFQSLSALAFCAAVVHKRQLMFSNTLMENVI